MLTQWVQKHLAELGEIIVKLKHRSLLGVGRSMLDALAATQFRLELDKFQQPIENYADAADVSKVEIIKTITKVLNHTKRSN